MFVFINLYITFEVLEQRGTNKKFKNMKKFLVQSNSLEPKMFNSFNDCLMYLDSLNIKYFDGEDYCIMGSPYNYRTDKHEPYMVDSVILSNRKSPKRKTPSVEYVTFLIYAFDSETNERLTLD